VLATEGVGVVERIARDKFEVNHGRAVSVGGDGVNASEHGLFFVGGDDDCADGNAVGMTASLSNANGRLNSPICWVSQGMSISIFFIMVVTSVVAVVACKDYPCRPDRSRLRRRSPQVKGVVEEEYGHALSIFEDAGVAVWIVFEGHANHVSGGFYRRNPRTFWAAESLGEQRG
jgi:hypothetical protein